MHSRFVSRSRRSGLVGLHRTTLMPTRPTESGTHQAEKLISAPEPRRRDDNNPRRASNVSFSVRPARHQRPYQPDLGHDPEERCVYIHTYVSSREAINLVPENLHTQQTQSNVSPTPSSTMRSPPTQGPPTPSPRRIAAHICSAPLHPLRRASMLQPPSSYARTGSVVVRGGRRMRVVHEARAGGMTCIHSLYHLVRNVAM